MSENNNSSGGGIGFCGLLAIVFITLKLTGVISWSWWWVTAPLWGGLAIVCCGALFVAAVMAFIALLAGLFYWIFGRDK